MGAAYEIGALSVLERLFTRPGIAVSSLRSDAEPPGCQSPGE